MPLWEKFLHMLEYKAERAGVQVVRVNPRGTSRGLSYDDPLRDWISARRILQSGLGQPYAPAEMKPPLAFVPASLIVEAGSPHHS
ncbi:MAG: zinc ribbon domain-containing protein [Thermoproteota archaeon]